MNIGLVIDSTIGIPYEIVKKYAVRTVRYSTHFLCLSAQE